jgi:hypothetical protein
MPSMRIFIIRPLVKIEEDLENLYYLDAIKKYFAYLIKYN